MALVIDWQIGHIEAPLLEIGTGMEDRVMLDLVGDDMTALHRCFTAAPVFLVDCGCSILRLQNFRLTV